MVRLVERYQKDTFATEFVESKRMGEERCLSGKKSVAFLCEREIGNDLLTSDTFFGVVRKQ